MAYLLPEHNLCQLLDVGAEGTCATGYAIAASLPSASCSAAGATPSWTCGAVADNAGVVKCTAGEYECDCFTNSKGEQECVACTKEVCDTEATGGRAAGRALVARLPARTYLQATGLERFSVQSLPR